MFLTLNNIITELRDFSSNIAEYNLEMLRRNICKFTIFQLVVLIDSVKRKHTLMQKKQLGA